MKHLDTYSGFGGFRLAVETVWPDSKLHAFVEIDPFCQRWLRANWPGCRIISDAKDYKHDGTTIDILTGGPPCQPVSVAGKGKGDSDDRWQWPTMLRIIQDVTPTWIIFENVSNLINFDSGILFDGILTDMETAGYETATFVFPACSQNAPHRRDRVFVVANSINRGRRQGGERGGLPEIHGERSDKRMQIEKSDQGNGNVANSERNGRGKGDSSESRQESRSTLTDNRIPPITNYGWNDSEWITGHDGKQRRVKPGIRLLAHGFPHRNDLLRGFGNAIVPQVVVPIMEAIKMINGS